MLWGQGHTTPQGRGTLAHTGTALRIPMTRGWGPEAPAHTGRGPGTLMLQGWGPGTPIP